LIIAAMIVVAIGVAVRLMTGNEPSDAAKSVAATTARASLVKTEAERPPIESPAELRANRKAYAKQLDQVMLDAGIESTTRSAGPEDTTLLINCALAGRVMANSISGRLDWDKIRSLHFRKVILTNGFEGDMNQTFYWNVK
jgi:hypothetical protein